MKIITVASYYGSGSSAVTDLVSEYKNVKSLTNYEFRFAQDPDGLSELEYNLVDNFNRHNSGHALKRYKKMVDYYGDHLLARRYEPFFNGKWKTESYKYIDSLTDFSYPGIWQYDFYDKGRLYDFFAKLPDRILTRTIWRGRPDKHCLPKGETLASHPSEKDFIEKTQAYTTNLFKAANPNDEPYLLVDQLVPSTNIARHMRYFKNIKAIVVDRDPRDIYLLAKYEWHDTIVPKDTGTFCKWYRYARSTKDNERGRDILFVQFEDLIYKYEETSNEIERWLGLDRAGHINKQKCLNPKKSIKNTQYWVSHPEYKEEARYIAKELEEYLYVFPKND